MNQIANKWKDYECYDCGNKEKLERFGNIILRRPDPQAIWPIDDEKFWKKCNAHYHRSKAGGGHWEFHKKLPDKWTINYRHLTFKVTPTNFKHTGIFPEQACNWDYAMDKIKNANREIRVLNLFAYTGCATMACASSGASEVVHVDASKGMVEWAKENMKLSHLENKHIRFIVDDVIKFVEREKRRGRTYHAIIMDPPSYGRGPNKEVWKIEDQLYTLIKKCCEILDDDPLFMLVNCYTTGFSPLLLQTILERLLLSKFPDGKITAGENTIPVSHKNSLLPCGIFGRFER